MISIQLNWLELLNVWPLEEWVSSVQDTVDNMEVTRLELSDQLSKQVRPLAREVLSTNHTDSIT